MRLDGRRNSNNVVDRRSSGKALGIGGGIVGVIVAGIITLLSGGNIGDVVEQIKELLDGRTDIYQFDIDKNQEAADSLNVESLPTFIVYRDGKEVWRHSGEMDGQVLLSKIESYL